MRRLPLSRAKSLITAQPELMELGAYLVQGGAGRGTTADLVAEAADAAIDFEKLIKGDLGRALEAIDYVVFRSAAWLLFPKMQQAAAQLGQRVGQARG